MSWKKNLKEQISKIDNDQDKLDFINELTLEISKLNPVKVNPMCHIKWVPVEQVEPNDYNPNSVPKKELGLLYTSIYHDGYTQPTVTIWDAKKKKYIIVDGFHRWYICKSNKDIYERNKGRIGVVVLDKEINDRMASTVRHNRARGKHSVDGMSNIVYEMLKNGSTDEEICRELGMEAEELIKLKHITGFAKLFSNHEYSKSWKLQKQIEVERDYFKNKKNDKSK